MLFLVFCLDAGNGKVVKYVEKMYLILLISSEAKQGRKFLLNFPSFLVFPFLPFFEFQKEFFFLVLFANCLELRESEKIKE